MRDGLCKSRSAGVVQGEINESSDQVNVRPSQLEYRSGQFSAIEDQCKVG